MLIIQLTDSYVSVISNFIQESNQYLCLNKCQPKIHQDSIRKKWQGLLQKAVLGFHQNLKKNGPLRPCILIFWSISAIVLPRKCVNQLSSPAYSSQRSYFKQCNILVKPSQVALVVKNLPANAGDTEDVGLIPGLGRSTGEGHGDSLQCSCLENPMDRGA